MTTAATEATRLDLLNHLRDHLNARMDTLHPRRLKDGSLGSTGKDEAIAFICGAAAAIDALGLGESHGLTGVAFLAAVRGPEEFVKG